MSEADLPAGWTWVATEELFSFVTSGSRGWAKYYSDAGAPFIRIGDLNRGTLRVDWSSAQRVSPPAGSEGSRTRVQPGDLLVSITADLGVIGVVPDNIPEAYINQHVALARPISDVVPRFIGWFLDSENGGQHQFRRRRKGATKAGLGLQDIRALRVPVPPRIEQQAIVGAIETQFSRLDAAVASLTRAKANVKRARASVLKAAVEGRLVPTEAELARAEGRDYEPASALLAGILAERRARHEAEQEGAKRRKKYKEPLEPDLKHAPPLPEGWAYCRIDTAGKVQLGRQRSPKNHQGPNMRPYLRVANVFEARIDLSDVMEMNFSEEEFEKYRLHPSDILLNEGQSPHLVGRPAMWSGQREGMCFTNSLVRFQAGPGVLPAFALIVFRAQLAARRYMKLVTITTNIAHLGAQRFAAVEFPLAPLAEQHRIVAEADRQLSVLDALEATIDTNLTRCERLRQSILKLAFEGRLVTGEST